MSVYYYEGSSQVALKGDTVEGTEGLTAGKRGELVCIWFEAGAAERNRIQAEVAWSDGEWGITTSVPLRTLVYIPPEKVAAERLGAEMAETERLATELAQALEAADDTPVGPDPYWVRREALHAAVRTLVPSNGIPPAEVAGRIIDLATRLVTFLAPDQGQE